MVQLNFDTLFAVTIDEKICHRAKKYAALWRP